MTDPYGNGWYEDDPASGTVNEIGSYCVGQFDGCVSEPQAWGQTQWQLPEVWSNALRACVQR